MFSSARFLISVCFSLGGQCPRKPELVSRSQTGVIGAMGEGQHAISGRSCYLFFVSSCAGAHGTSRSQGFDAALCICHPLTRVCFLSGALLLFRRESKRPRTTCEGFGRRLAGSPTRCWQRKERSAAPAALARLVMMALALWYWRVLIFHLAMLSVLSP